MASLNSDLKNTGNLLYRRPIEETFNHHNEEPFGHHGAARYDEDASYMPRRYKSAHAIQNRLVCDALDNGKAEKNIVVDLGCGTGADGLDILARSKNIIYVGVDYSPHMLNGAKEKFARRDLLQRSLFLELDFRVITTDVMLRALRSAGFDSGISCVISALALHHYDIGAKMNLYRGVHEILPTGGLFIVTDLYSNAIAHCAQGALEKELTDIRRVSERISGQKCTPSHTTISERHYREDNQPQVLSDEMSMLSLTGFVKSEPIFRNGQLGIIVSERGIS